MDTYYNPADLEKFGDMAKDATEMGKAFFSYYGKVFEDGALTAREKSLMALSTNRGRCLLVTLMLFYPVKILV